MQACSEQGYFPVIVGNFYPRKDTVKTGREELKWRAYVGGKGAAVS